MDIFDYGVRSEKKISFDRREDRGVIADPALRKSFFYPVDDIFFPDDILQVKAAG
ncbi:MAG: hypothetical protein JW746_05600 [Candidatus Krumholzibacteriota bacterium]|nr:hypothetical protein [Candidatus Krumholzibacteriota bacterium]